MAKDSNVSCREVVRQLFDYLDGELDAQLADAIRAHLEGCDACAQETVFEKQMLHGLRQHLRQTPAPHALVARVRSMLRTWQPVPPQA